MKQMINIDQQVALPIHETTEKTTYKSYVNATFGRVLPSHSSEQQLSPSLTLPHSIANMSKKAMLAWVVE